ncbi:hypothetical protein ACHAXR_001505 [Thalassiosira sp. AJA248-18]
MSKANEDTPQCAACGKGGDALKKCNSCKLVKYCNINCQRAHWSVHKNVCKQRAAEIHDETLFKEPPPFECPICFIHMPNSTNIIYQTCCGKLICCGCEAGVEKECKVGVPACPFCRVLGPTTDKEIIRRVKKRMDVNDGEAFYMQGSWYKTGDFGFPQDLSKALELWHKAAQLGCAEAHAQLGNAYFYGQGVDKDKRKAKHHHELAAIGGHTVSRHNLASYDIVDRKMKRAMKHYMIAAGAGYAPSLQYIREGYLAGHISKNEYEQTLRAFQGASNDLKSDRRKEAMRNCQITGVKIEHR